MVARAGSLLKVGSSGLGLALDSYDVAGKVCKEEYPTVSYEFIRRSRVSNMYRVKL